MRQAPPLVIRRPGRKLRRVHLHHTPAALCVGGTFNLPCVSAAYGNWRLYFVRTGNKIANSTDGVMCRWES